MPIVIATPTPNLTLTLSARVPPGKAFGASYRVEPRVTCSCKSDFIARELIGPSKLLLELPKDILNPHRFFGFEI
jgi:hypothetical protein